MEPNTRPRITPKDFFLWAGAMIALYWSVVSLILLFFNYINYALPNPLSYAVNPYDGGMPYEMASILVLVPVYMALALYIRSDIARDPSRKDSWLRRWDIILTLFVTGATIAIDVITLLTTFFRGEEITLAFILKVLVVLIAALAGFLYFVADLKGYWDAHRSREHGACWAFGLFALATIIAGFFIVGTPYQARLMRFDEQRVSDLQTIQYQVVNYWQSKEKLPTSLTALEDPISGYAAPTDPQSGSAYEYSTTGAKSFELCATFARADQNPSNAPYAAPIPAGAKGTDSWAHPAGRYCYARTIDPQLYPPFSKTR